MVDARIHWRKPAFAGETQLARLHIPGSRVIADGPAGNQTLRARRVGSVSQQDHRRAFADAPSAVYCAQRPPGRSRSATMAKPGRPGVGVSIAVGVGEAVAVGLQLR